MMTVDWAHFTPYASLAGGALIGTAAGLFFLMCGRIAGISGIVAGLFAPFRGDRAWRVLFVAGLIGAPLLYRLAAPLPQAAIEAGYPQLVLAGLLVGLGTRYAGGCTSGHGVCGISRLSARSIVATLLFMAAGIATVYVMRHAAGA
jgi:uncharacterized membrane protein YedE/YeeE